LPHPLPELPPDATRAGTLHIRHRHTERYTVGGNHLAWYAFLSATAIGVGVYIQSLPDGASVNVKALTLRFPEGETTIGRALRELEVAGYPVRRRLGARAVPLGRQPAGRRGRRDGSRADRGQTKLIYGSPSRIDATAKQLRAFQTAFDTTGDDLKGLDSSRLKGEAADALRTAVNAQPPKWYTAADACTKAVALTWDHRDVVSLTQTERILTADSRQEEIDRRFFAIATDLVGTPTELIDETGDIAWHSRSTLWGTTAWSKNSSTYTPLRFPGQYYDPETGIHYTSPDPLVLAPAPNPVGYVDNPNTASDPLGLMPKYTKEEKAQKRIDKVLDDIADRAQNGEINKHAKYHGDTRHGFSDERVLEILKNPDAVYQSSGQAGNFIFRKDNDIAVVYGPGSKQGQAVAAYGESGIKGPSGVKALGGSPTDPGAPVTHEDIVQGRIPTEDGYLPPAQQIR
jgi:hypothetical protein